MSPAPTGRIWIFLHRAEKDFLFSQRSVRKLAHHDLCKLNISLKRHGLRNAARDVGDAVDRTIMRGAAKDRYHLQFRDSFGFPDDPFPTLLAGGTRLFAFYYEDDPLDGCIRFPAETECERLMGLPDGWTKYGAGSELISPAQRRAKKRTS